MSKGKHTEAEIIAALKQLEAGAGDSPYRFFSVDERARFYDSTSIRQC